MLNSLQTYSVCIFCCQAICKVCFMSKKDVSDIFRTKKSVIYIYFSKKQNAKENIIAGGDFIISK